MKIRPGLKLLFIVALISFFSSLALAATSVSSHYIMRAALIVSSGGKASSIHYRLIGANLGNLIGGKAASSRYKLDAARTNLIISRIPPRAPTLNPIVSPTSVNQQILSGTKESGTSIYINGYLCVPLDNQVIWSYNQTLAEGFSSLIITARNIVGLESPSIATSIFLDTSSPTAPVVADDGVYTNSYTQLHARWSSIDTQTGIVQYQYAIGTRPKSTDIVSWTSTGIDTEVTKTGLSLAHGQVYYFSVKAKNGVDLWSTLGISDGIRVNQNIPVILDIQPESGSYDYAPGSVDFSVNASDMDSDSLLYQFSIDGQIIQPWQSSPMFNWSTSGESSGVHTIKAEVSDSYGGVVFQNIGLCLFRRPLGPPTQPIP